jgi:DNA-binding CsgD family transcriptional regulator
MGLSSGDARLESIRRLANSEAHDALVPRTGSARRQPLLMLLNRDGELLYCTAFAESRVSPSTPESLFTRRLVDQVLIEARRPAGREERGGARWPIGEARERCVLVTLGSELFCLRLFPLVGTDGSELCGALVEPIDKPRPDEMNVSRIRDLFRLSKREIDVLGALMSGDTDKEIASKLAVSVETVRAYLKSIRAKLRAKTRTAIVSIIHGVQADPLSRGR